MLLYHLHALKVSEHLRIRDPMALFENRGVELPRINPIAQTPRQVDRSECAEHNRNIAANLASADGQGPSG
jgi:hypothetical protein